MDEPQPLDERLSDALVFEVARRWLSANVDEQKKLTSGIADWLVEKHARDLPWIDLRWSKKKKVALTRYRIYKIVRQAIERGFVQLNTPRAVTLREALVEKFGLQNTAQEICVVDVGHHVNELVAEATAETALALILKLARIHKKEARERGLSKPEPVGIGLGAGYSSWAVVSHLATLVNALPNPPRLRLHALTPTLTNTKISPVTYFSLFNNEENEYVDLPTAATVACRDYEDLKKQDVNIARAFELRDKVQIIITSLAAADDEHGTWRMYNDLHQNHPEFPGVQLVGDLQYLPYSRTEPIYWHGNPGRRAVTLFDWPDLQQFAASGDRYLVICAAPCRVCGEYKTKAIVPLLERIRVWTHLVTDRATAGQLLEAPGDGTDP